jgi:hypothetical protein
MLTLWPSRPRVRSFAAGRIRKTRQRRPSGEPRIKGEVEDVRRRRDRVYVQHLVHECLDQQPEGSRGQAGYAEDPASQALVRQI